ncbi:hypothetical protein Tco_0209016 [Tanacetum coccineum]
MGLPSTVLDEEVGKTQPPYKGTNTRDKDSKGLKPPADMKPSPTLVSDTSRTDAKYQVDHTQSTRLSDVDDVLEAGEEIDEDIPPTDEEAQSPPPNQEQPESSHTHETDESDSDSSCPDVLKKYDNILPLTKRKLVKYLKNVS